MDSIFVQIRYTLEEKNYPSFNDALYYGLDEYNGMDTSIIEQEKQLRFTNFKKFIDHPPPPPQLTKEEIIARLNQQKLDLQNNLIALESEIIIESNK